ncbi:hypothetical protein V1478_016611 [Vespula squamosa]|uniref:Uncharacterized protein n=1 Tax=Vespula squamosa TaxID=30214 RepID=A0ABD2A0D0_VESSQ
MDRRETTLGRKPVITVVPRLFHEIMYYIGLSRVTTKEYRCAREYRHVGDKTELRDHKFGKSCPSATSIRPENGAYGKDFVEEEDEKERDEKKKEAVVERLVESVGRRERRKGGERAGGGGGGRGGGETAAKENATTSYEVNLAVRISPRSPECTILNGITTSAEQAVPAKEEEEEKKKKEAKEEKEE